MEKVFDRYRFVESIHHILYYGDQIEGFIETKSLIELDEHHHQDITTVAFQSYIILLTNSLLDEINNYLFRYNSPDERVNEKLRDLKYIIEPAITKITKLWPDIKRFRNNVLAHSMRIDNEGHISAVVNIRLADYKIPNFIIELEYLRLYISVICLKVEEIFSEEYEEALAIKSRPGDVTSSTSNLELDLKHHEEYNNCVVEIEKRIEKYSRNA